MMLVVAFVAVTAAIVGLAIAGEARPFSLAPFLVGPAVVAVAGAALGFFRLRSLEATIGTLRAAVPMVPTGLVEAPTEKVATLLGGLRGLGFEVAGATDTSLGGGPPIRTWALAGEPGTTWVEVGMAAVPMAVFLSRGGDGRFLETTASHGETIDHPSLYATCVEADPPTALATHRRTLAEWESRTGPALVVRTFDDYLAVEAELRDRTAGLRIVAFVERVVKPGLRAWAVAAVIAAAGVAVLWGLDLARR